MKVGFVGLGKLGLPVALAVESKGHKVYGFDIKKEIYKQPKNNQKSVGNLTIPMIGGHFCQPLIGNF